MKPTNPTPETPITLLPCPKCHYLPGWAGCARAEVTLVCCGHFESWPDFPLAVAAWNQYVKRQKEKPDEPK